MLRLFTLQTLALLVTIQAANQPKSKLAPVSQAAYQEIRSAQNAWIDKSIEQLRQDPAGDDWLAYVISLPELIQRPRQIDGSKEEREQTVQQLTNRFYQAVAQSVRWNPDSVLIDSMAQRLDNFQPWLPETTRVEILLTILMHRPEFLHEWQKKQRQPTPELVITLLSLEVPLGRQLVGPLLLRSLQTPSPATSEILDAITLPENHQATLSTVAERWLQGQEATPQQWLPLLTRLEKIPTALDSPRDRWLVDINNLELATAAGVSKILSGQMTMSPELQQAAQAARRTSPSAVHQFVLGLLLSQQDTYAQQADDGNHSKLIEASFSAQLAHHQKTRTELLPAQGKETPDPALKGP